MDARRFVMRKQIRDAEADSTPIANPPEEYRLPPGFYDALYASVGVSRTPPSPDHPANDMVRVPDGWPNYPSSMNPKTASDEATARLARVVEMFAGQVAPIQRAFGRIDTGGLRANEVRFSLPADGYKFVYPSAPATTRDPIWSATQIESRSTHGVDGGLRANDVVGPKCTDCGRTQAPSLARIGQFDSHSQCGVVRAGISETDRLTSISDCAYYTKLRANQAHEHPRWEGAKCQSCGKDANTHHGHNAPHPGYWCVSCIGAEARREASK